MRFRPCIDIHNGKVKQIVGSSLRDAGDSASENFVSARGADYYARMYKELGLFGGHIILLNPQGSPFYEMTKKYNFPDKEEGYNMAWQTIVFDRLLNPWFEKAGVAASDAQVDQMLSEYPEVIPVSFMSPPTRTVPIWTGYMTMSTVPLPSIW